jgi:4-hydroxythreonine-4-phosphate dehydrogenase
MQKPKIAISIGDINGVGPEIAIRAHEKIKEICEPVYCVPRALMDEAALKIGIEELDFDFLCVDFNFSCTIRPGEAAADSGELSYKSFKLATSYAKSGRADAVVTLPINKKAWEMAGVPHKGHTDALSDIFGKRGIMMLGCEELFVALYTDHVPLKEVASLIKQEPIAQFLEEFYKAGGFESVGVLGFNPHAGDGGVLGSEEEEIKAAIEMANKTVGKEVFFGPLVPDVAFTPHSKGKYAAYVAMYHDQGLAPLKALHFDESINVTLGLPIIRTSPDHGTAYDIAYKLEANTKSYENAVKEAVRLATKDKKESFV